MGTVTNITAEMGEECKVDVDILHETLEKLPADKYLSLFRKMHEKIYGYSIYAAWNGGCGCTPIEEKQE